MMTLITGGSGSGKSAYAEQYTMMLAGEKKKYYLATMQVWDKEGEAKIERHRKLRRGKGFCTVEQPVSIEESVQRMEAGEKVALLECMSNLTANEMFAQEIPRSAQWVTDKIIQDIQELKHTLNHLVIVTNNVFEDGNSYDETTMEYIRSLGSINERLTEMADEIIEVVVGIPVILKSGC